MIYKTKKQKTEILLAFVKVALTLLEDYDNKEISNFTGLSVSTIYRLRAGKISLSTHFGTILALELAAGLEFDIDEGTISLRRRRRHAKT